MSFQQFITNPQTLQVVLVVLLETGLLLLSAFLLTHSVDGMMKGIKVALKGEFNTDAGKLNLIGMILFAILYIFSDLHQIVAETLSVTKPAPGESHVVVGVLLFGLGFVISLLIVMISEIKLKS
jgi:hypothetical protein